MDTHETAKLAESLQRIESVLAAAAGSACDVRLADRLANDWRLRAQASADRLRRDARVHVLLF